MDQGCAFGNRPVLMTFDGDRLETQELQINNELYFVVVDLQAQKDTMEILNRTQPLLSSPKMTSSRVCRNCWGRLTSAWRTRP
jgi:galactokinase